MIDHYRFINVFRKHGKKSTRKDFLTKYRIAVQRVLFFLHCRAPDRPSHVSNQREVLHEEIRLTDLCFHSFY